jgi:hypothetical protein
MLPSERPLFRCHLSPYIPLSSERLLIPLNNETGRCENVFSLSCNIIRNKCEWGRKLRVHPCKQRKLTLILGGLSVPFLKS